MQLKDTTTIKQTYIGTYHIDKQRRLLQACANAQTCKASLLTYRIRLKFRSLALMDTSAIAFEGNVCGYAIGTKCAGQLFCFLILYFLIFTFPLRIFK